MTTVAMEKQQCFPLVFLCIYVTVNDIINIQCRRGNRVTCFPHCCIVYVSANNMKLTWVFM
jgi:hypothetical protein